VAFRLPRWLPHALRTHGFMEGEGFLISSMSPAMFFKKRLCMLFSSISLSLTTGGLDVFIAIMVVEC